MKVLYCLTDIRDSKDMLLEGWVIRVVRHNSACEYKTQIFYKDGMLYWESYVSRDLIKLLEDTIDKIEWMVKNIPEDALNAKQQWSHVRSFGNYGTRVFVMLLKCNGKAQLKRFKETSDIFNQITNFIPDCVDMLEEDWQGGQI